MPRAILFAYWDKLQTELNLFESQNIITSVSEAYAPSAVTPKKH